MIAVCVSGLARDGYQEAIETAKKTFPYDFFFAHWKGRPVPSVDNCLLVDEPEYGYHNLLETTIKPKCNIWKRYTKRPNGKIFRKPDLMAKTKDHSKQILIHQTLVDSLDKKYDTIIRVRYDTIFSLKQDFSELVKLGLGGTIIGLAGSMPGADLDAQIKIHKHNDCRRCQGWYLWDHMIIHPRHKLKNSYNFFHKNNLLGAEWGWYQVLCHQWKDDNYVNAEGGNVLLKHRS
jgi:hypothetical protein